MSLRLFHVVESFDGQATERWLTRLMANAADHGRGYEWIFFSALPRKGKYDDEARRLGATVLHSATALEDTFAFLTGLRRAMKESRAGVLHCHHDVMSGLYLLASAGLPFKKRIVHVHNTSLALPTPSRIKAHIVTPALRSLCLRMADNVAGVSKESLEALTRGDPPRKRRDLVIPGGIDTRLFREHAAERRLETRRILGLTEGEVALLFAGRLVETKNPSFCLKVLQSLKQRGFNASLLVAGEGPLREALAEEARRSGLAENVKLIGFREDLADLMLASDLLVWTAQESPKEGLGLVVVEAQAAGLPIVASKSIPSEAVVIPEDVHFLNLEDGPDVWADTIQRTMVTVRPSREACLTRVEASPCSLEASATAMFNLYDEAIAGTKERK